MKTGNFSGENSAASRATNQVRKTPFGLRCCLQVVGHQALGPAAGGDDDVLEGPGLLAGGDEDAVGGFGDAVDRGVGVDGCAVGLGGGDRRRDRTVGAQGAGVGVVDGDVVGAEVVLGVAFGHLFAAEDFVVGAVGPGGFQQGWDVGPIGGSDGESAAAGEDVLAGLGFELGPEIPGALQDGVEVRHSAVEHAEEPGVAADGAAGVGGCVGFESGDGIGQAGGLPEGHGSDAAQADDGEFSVHG